MYLHEHVFTRGGGLQRRREENDDEDEKARDTAKRYDEMK